MVTVFAQTHRQAFKARCLHPHAGSATVHPQRLKVPIKKGALLPPPTHENSVLSKGQVFLGSS
jgi:hypothetical protein